MVKSHCCLPQEIAPEDFKVKAHVDHGQVRQHSPQIPTVGKTALGQAGDITLAMGPGQIYQNL